MSSPARPCSSSSIPPSTRFLATTRPQPKPDLFGGASAGSTSLSENPVVDKHGGNPTDEDLISLEFNDKIGKIKSELSKTSISSGFQTVLLNYLKINLYSSMRYITIAGNEEATSPPDIDVIRPHIHVLNFSVHELIRAFEFIFHTKDNLDSLMLHGLRNNIPNNMFDLISEHKRSGKFDDKFDDKFSNNFRSIVHLANTRSTKI